jgi:hypothetical protein
MNDEQHVCVFFIPTVEGFLVDLEFKKFLSKLQFYPPMITILPFPFLSQHAGHMLTSIIKTVLAGTRGYLSTWNLVWTWFHVKTCLVGIDLLIQSVN